VPQICYAPHRSSAETRAKPPQPARLLLLARTRKSAHARAKTHNHEERARLCNRLSQKARRVSVDHKSAKINNVSRGFNRCSHGPADSKTLAENFPPGHLKASSSGHSTYHSNHSMNIQKRAPNSSKLPLTSITRTISKKMARPDHQRGLLHCTQQSDRSITSESNRFLPSFSLHDFISKTSRDNIPGRTKRIPLRHSSGLRKLIPLVKIIRT